MNLLSDIRWAGKVALVRADFNIPMDKGAIVDDFRVRASVPTIQFIARQGAAVVVLSHLGRPEEASADGQKFLSLAPVADRLGELLQMPVRFCRDFPRARPPKGEIWLLENTRFRRGERQNDPALGAQYAALGDVFVLDALSVAHRQESTVCALADSCAETCAGLSLSAELSALSRVSSDAQAPVVGIFGGAKITAKLPAILRLQKICWKIIVGGGIANTLLSAAGLRIGRSVAQKNMMEESQKILRRGNIVLPEDVVVADSPDETRKVRAVEVSEVGAQDMILDFSVNSRRRAAKMIRAANTVLWNGPVGLFENPAARGGTEAIVRAVGDSAAFSLAGGGDTLAAIHMLDGGEKFSHLSTAGGALLEYLGGATLPGLSAIGAAQC